MSIPAFPTWSSTRHGASGETVVQGAVSPDEYRVFKPLLRQAQAGADPRQALGAKERKLIYARGGKHTTRMEVDTARERQHFVLSDDEILALARWAVAIERHYGTPMDMEWAKDGETGELHCVQARPETVHSRKQTAVLESYRLSERAEPIVTGVAIGQAIASGPVRILRDPSEMDRFEDGRHPGDGAHRSRLGADHEARGRHRDGSRRAHQPRRDRQPGDRHPGRRWVPTTRPCVSQTARPSRFRAPRARRGGSTRGSSRTRGRRSISRGCRSLPSRS
jgi:hypothetical protein